MKRHVYQRIETGGGEFSIFNNINSLFIYIDVAVVEVVVVVVVIVVVVVVVL